MKRVDVITLGCSKNLVDSERLLRRLEAAGYDAHHDEDLPQQGSDVVVINTCGFIGDAKEESINTILEAVEAKRAGLIGELHVMGCLSERYRAELPTEIPEVTRWWGKHDWTGIIDELSKKSSLLLPRPFDRKVTTPSHHAYLKIAEGCNRFCAFCAIPLITGRYSSRDFDEVIEEVRMLTGRGVKELNVIAQDLSAYGEDRYGHNRLAELIDRIADVDGVEWIRLHYAYPAGFPMELLDVMAQRDNVCRYLDIALQHSSDKVLSAMRRHITAEGQRQLLAEIRRRVPGIHLRTTLMTGFPGEGEKEFEELMDFVREQRFERMGAFAYCEEEDTFAARNYADTIPQDEKQRRLDSLMQLQEGISAEIQQEKVGKTLKVIIDQEGEDYYEGRTEWDSPEVDPMVLVKKTARLRPGEFATVKVDEALPFELIATPVSTKINAETRKRV